ncbi:hypothetical protein E2N92_09860 [Methanofollis formosanus]|uniref:Uncharacterized protein n=1 Tax=Methanofollis formosanus TaxID=299308 RepID=A0A8G1EGD3_9EURY|nr:hypothetical protein [Methanofollis formosanus]QYZ79708.1 hypothetical protein E2N92_09860 [Methanofollis formosanus]
MKKAMLPALPPILPAGAAGSCPQIGQFVTYDNDLQEETHVSNCEEYPCCNHQRLFSADLRKTTIPSTDIRLRGTRPTGDSIDEFKHATDVVISLTTRPYPIMGSTLNFRVPSDIIGKEGCPVSLPARCALATEKATGKLTWQQRASPSEILASPKVQRRIAILRDQNDEECEGDD